MFALLRRLEAREKRAIALLTAAALLFLVFDFGVFPLMDTAEKQRAALPLKEKTLRKYQNLVALAGAEETDWQNLQARLAGAEKSLLDSRSPALASAEVQDVVKRLMGQAGIDMRTADFLGTRTLKEGYTVVPISTSFECTLDQLANFLLIARGSAKALALSQLSISASPPRADRPKKMVIVRMTIQGLMVAEPAAAPKL